MAGTITTSVIQNDTSSPPTFRNNSVEIGTLCRAWVNFNGTGTVAIRASFNVSSITDNGTGQYTVNFTNAFADANYAINVTGTLTGGSSSTAFIGTTDGANNLAGSAKVQFLNGSFAYTDPSNANASVFR